jgi:hypothetical protein
MLSDVKAKQTAREWLDDLWNWQPVGLKTHNADLREKYFGAKQVNMLISNDLQSIHGLSKMLISESETSWQ